MKQTLASRAVHGTDEVSRDGFRSPDRVPDKCPLHSESTNTTLTVHEFAALGQVHLSYRDVGFLTGDPVGDQRI